MRWLICCLGLVIGCGTPAPEDTLEDGGPFLITYASILEAGYDDAVLGAEALNAALEPIVLGRATERDLERAREAWIAARPPYLQTEIARFYGGPIDGEHGPEPRINGWPMDEAYLDDVVDAEGRNVEGGLVNLPDLLPTIDLPSLIEANLRGGEQNVATGYHAIEFLLWGQDRWVDGPGRRPASDFVSAPNADRRRAMLGVLGQLLVRDLSAVRDAWRAGEDTNFRGLFLRMPPRQALRLVLAGMLTLAGTELAGERMNVAYLTREAEDEHSCFSDTTHLDQRSDGLGLRNVYLGRYVRTDGRVVEGPSLSALVARRTPALDVRARAELERVVEALSAVPPPFDQAILGAEDGPGRTAVSAAIRALRTFASTLVEIAASLGIRLNAVA